MEEIDLKELLSILWEKKLVITIIVLISMLLGLIYTMFLVTPKYKASTTLVLVSNNSDSNAQSGVITTTDITLNSKLVSTYSEIIKSNSVLNKVIENLNLNEFTIASLKKCISVSEVQDAEVVKVSVTHENAIYSYKIANEIAKVFIDKAEELYNINNIKVLDVAELPENPSNVNNVKDMIIFTIAGIVIGVAYVFVLNMLDNTVKYAEDIEKITKLPVLATIPNGANDKKRGGNK